MRSWLFLILLVPCVAAAVLSASPSLAEPPPSFPDAPPISVAWVKGGPVDLNKAGHLYVIELWATWCGPCIEGFPHLSSLQRAHRADLTVVAISDESERQVKKFLDQNAAITDFAFAVSEETSIAWGSTFRVESIPAAFIVRDKQVLWFGHPEGIDPVLRAIQSKVWTPDTFLRHLNVEVTAQMYIEALFSDAPPDAATLTKAADRLIEDGRFSPNVLNKVVWLALTEAPAAQRPLADLLRMAEAADRAADLQDFNIADTYALALFESDKIPEAISAEERALKLCLTQQNPPECSPLQEALDHFKARAPKAAP